MSPTPTELDLFADFCGEILTTETGEPLILRDFQRQNLAEHFAGVRETLNILPKKQGKSSILGARGIYKLIRNPNAEIALVARARDQAGLMLKQARGYISRSPYLRKRLKVVQREIRHRGGIGSMAVKAADEETLDGWLGDLALVDELGRWKSLENYMILRAGVAARGGQIIGITTAGDDETSPLGVVRNQALERLTLRTDPDNPRHRRAVGPGFALHEWGLQDGDDVMDPATVKLANPLLTLDAIREELESPSFNLYMHERYRCGLWTAGEDGAIAKADWAECVNAGCTIPEGAPGVFIGVDMGLKWDTTAMVPTARIDGGKVRVHTPTILEPPRDGTALDFEDIKDTARELHASWPKATWVLDPEQGGELLAQFLANELGANVVTVSQRVRPMCEASQGLAESVATRAIEHPDDATLNAHVLSAAAKAHGVGWRLVKPTGKGGLYIDAAVALAIALRVLAASERKPAKRRKGVRADTNTPIFA